MNKPATVFDCSGFEFYQAAFGFGLNCPTWTFLEEIPVGFEFGRQTKRLDLCCLIPNFQVAQA